MKRAPGRGEGATSFFTQQDRARRNTRVLVVFMILAVLCMGLSIFGLWTVVQGFFHPRELVYG